MTPIGKPFENIVGKGENAGKQHLLLFPQCFLPYRKQISILEPLLFLSSANALNLAKSKILSFGKELMYVMNACKDKTKDKNFAPFW